MIPASLTEFLQSRQPRGYVGRHRAPREQRHLAPLRAMFNPRSEGVTPEPETA